MEKYITKIHVEESRGVQDLTINFSKDKRTHLILTGKNGSGKTSLLNELRYSLEKELETINETWSKIFRNRVDKDRDLFKKTKIEFSTESKRLVNEEKDFIVAFFAAHRTSNLKQPKGITKVDLRKGLAPLDKTNTEFLQYLVNLKADRSFARDDNEIEEIERIDNWFNNFELKLKEIFEVQNLKLKFDKKSYSFNIQIDNETIDFLTLSDGYSAIISIVSEIILRMEAYEVKSYDLNGVVLIDEIETHLHVNLQKKILPFLIDFFPKIQFIVSTHSPFVLSSISDCIVCDLETKTIIEDLTKYSYDALIENYFEVDKYSSVIKDKIAEFDVLSLKKELSTEEKVKLNDLRNYFAHLPKNLGLELSTKVQAIEMRFLKPKNK